MIRIGYFQFRNLRSSFPRKNVTPLRRIISRGGNPAWIPARASLGRNDCGSRRPSARVRNQALRRALGRIPGIFKRTR